MSLFKYVPSSCLKSIFEISYACVHLRQYRKPFTEGKQNKAKQKVTAIEGKHQKKKNRNLKKTSLSIRKDMTSEIVLTDCNSLLRE